MATSTTKVEVAGTDDTRAPSSSRIGPMIIPPPTTSRSQATAFSVRQPIPQSEAISPAGSASSGTTAVLHLVQTMSPWVTCCKICSNQLNAEICHRGRVEHHRADHQLKHQQHSSPHPNHPPKSRIITLDKRQRTFHPLSPLKHGYY